MKRLTMDVLLAGTLAVAPLAWAQETTGDIGAGSRSAVPHDTQLDRGERRTSPTRPAPATQRNTPQRNTPPFPGEDPTVPERVPTEVPPGIPPVATPPSVPSPRGSERDQTDRSTTTGSERAGNQPEPARAETGGIDGDVAIIGKVHDSNLKEIKICQLAADKAKSARVKSYARMLVADHKAFDRKLMALARKKNLEGKLQQVAAGNPTPPRPEGADMHARLMGETGAEFDQDFMATMVDEHDKAIQMVRSARDAASDPDLRALLDGALPKLEKHRKTAQDILDKHLKG
jgi:putative membrane protein